MLTVNEQVTLLLSEGIARAYAGSVGTMVKGEVDSLSSIAKSQSEQFQVVTRECEAMVDWLNEKKQDHPNLSLDMGAFKTWIKTSPSFTWRFYFMLDNTTFNGILKAIKSGVRSDIEKYHSVDLSSRIAATNLLDRAKKIDDLIGLVNLYKTRCSQVAKAVGGGNKGFPIFIMIGGSSDLRSAVKRIVNLAI